MQIDTAVAHDALRVMLVSAHLIAVAIAVGLVFWQDIALLTSRHMNSLQFQLASTRVTRALIVLWITGALIIVQDTGWDLGLLATKPKILAKLLVVTLLTLNGWALHRVAFPALSGTNNNSGRTAALIAVLGAISSVSWLYAIFLGVARPLAQPLGFEGFIGLYGALLALGIATALLFVRPRIKTLLFHPAGFTSQQVMAILLGMGRIEPAGTLDHDENLGRHVRHVALEARRHVPERQEA